MNNTLKILAASALIVSGNGMAQDVDKKILNWYNGAKYGMSTDKAYSKLLAGKKSETVIVAVIDSGVDIEHEDLKGKIWVNKDEIPGNGIDDDKNGYIDDVNGWSFLGNPDGENVNDEQLEVTRLYKQLDAKYKGKRDEDVPGADKEEFEKYKVYRDEVEGSRSKAKQRIKQYSEIITQFEDADKKLKTHFGGEYTAKDLKKLKKDPSLAPYAQMMMQLKQSGLGVDALKEELQGALDYFQGQLDYNYNTDFNARSIIGDNPTDFSDIYYGSNDVEGPDAFHGTHVAGIIAAVRGNGIGNDGVANDVQIMSVRAVPNGDERDKDVALAIRYAVDNGASVVNMSFGKKYSPYVKEVREAIKYAEDKGVLLIHAAGNEGMDSGVEAKYPNPRNAAGVDYKNWIEVGASTRYKKAKIDKKSGALSQDGLAASFSNYNKQIVDVFAPGLEIYSTTPDNKYEAIQGTSMACPMVAGVAALLKSYYPKLDMFEIRQIIFDSVQEVERETPIPGGTDMINFDELSTTGGIVNVYQAVELAEERSAGK